MEGVELRHSMCFVGVCTRMLGLVSMATIHKQPVAASLSSLLQEQFLTFTLGGVRILTLGQLYCSLDNLYTIIYIYTAIYTINSRDAIYSVI